MAKLEGKRVAILVAHEFEDIEVLYPLLRLSEEGARITLATLHSGFHPRPAFPEKPITGRFGSVIPPIVLREGKRFVHTNIDKLDVNEIDCVIIPGGFAPDRLRIDETTLNIVKTAYNQGKVIAAVCHGPQVLISAGVIKGKKATSYATVKDDLINAGADFQDIPVVRDGNIVTSRVPDDLPQFCQEIIKALSEG